jgi:hypothetical protein
MGNGNDSAPDGPRPEYDKSNTTSSPASEAFAFAVECFGQQTDGRP